MNNRERITEYVEYHGLNTLFLDGDGFDEAIVGIADANEEGGIAVVYSEQRLIKALEDSGMEYVEAVEYYDFNIAQAFVGPLTPHIITTVEELEI